jgi:predicted permease
MSAFFNKLRSIVRRPRRDDEIRAELQFHLDEEVDEIRAAGFTEEDARAAARRALGNPVVVAEDTRAAWGWRWLEHLAQDVVYALRVVRRRPGFSAAAILSLTLGIGGNVALFSLLDALLVESLPVSRPSELVELFEPPRQGSRPIDDFIYNHYLRLREGATRLDPLAGASLTFESEVFLHGSRQRVIVQMVSDNYFDTLGVEAARGRVFHAGAATAGSEPLAVISDSYWRRTFGGDPSAIGAALRYRTVDTTIVGIAPPQFKGIELEASVDVWLLVEQVVPPASQDRARSRWIRVFGRLAPGATVEQAAAEATAVMARPIILQTGGRPYSSLRAQLHQPLLLVGMVVVLVLAITCTNLANLTVAGNLARERELAVRRALGASRWRMVRQLLTETLVLVAAGTGGALLLARWITAALLGFVPPRYAPALLELRFDLDGRVLVLAVLATLVTTTAIGLLPALASTRGRSSSGLRVTAGGAPRTRTWTSRALIVGEIAACAVLLMVAGVFVRTVQNLRAQDAGYHEAQLLVADISFPRDYREPRRDVLIDELRHRVAALPGIERASFSRVGQLSGSGFGSRIGFPGAAASAGDRSEVLEERISPGFLATMGTRLIEGRDFADADSATAPAVAIVNEAFALRFFGGTRAAIGRTFYQEGGSRSHEPMEVIGVAQDARWLSLRSAPVPMYYRPYAQQGGTPVVRLALRTSRSVEVVIPQLLATAQAIDRDMTLGNIVPFAEVVNRTLVVERLVAYLSSVFAALGLLIAAIGLYGVLAYNVTRRRREIGVRIAVGASPGSVERMFLGESFALFALGLAIGAPLGIAVTRSVASMLYGIGPQDPSAIASVMLVLGLATGAAAYLPARRAASIDPIGALRDE